MKVAILGSSGAMGSFFAQYFVKKGHNVIGSDKWGRKRSPPGLAFTGSNPDAVRDADVVLVVVPIRETTKVIREVSSFLKRGSILVEITSVKAKIHAEAKKILTPRKVSLLSLHPLFGPSSRSKNFKICVVGKRRDTSVAKRLFPEAKLIQLSIREHDRLMAYTLSLVHLVNLAFVSALAKGVGVKEFERSATPTGSAQMNLAKAVLSQDPSLYSYIQIENPFVGDVLSSIITEFEDLRRIVGSHEASLFEERFTALAGEFRKTELENALQDVYLASSP